MEGVYMQSATSGATLLKGGNSLFHHGSRAHTILHYNPFFGGKAVLYCTRRETWPAWVPHSKHDT